MKLLELKELGLSKGQIQVYNALLELGTGGIQEIQEKTGLERRAIYDILNKLMEKGFVTYVAEKTKRKYQCTHPRSINETIEKKQHELHKLQEKIPQIIDMFVNLKQKIRAEVYRGNEAMKAFLNEILEYDASYWIGGNSGVEAETGEGMRHWYKQWMERRRKLKHVMHDLVDHGTWLEDFPPEDIEKHKKYYYKYCTLPKNMISPMVMIISGNKVAQILWSRRSFAFVLESPEIKESFMKYFHYFWKEPY